MSQEYEALKKRNESLAKTAKELAKVVDNPRRGTIIIYLGENSPSTFTELRLNTPEGEMNHSSLWHHMNKLIGANLVKKEKRGLYSLTSTGILLPDIYKLISKQQTPDLKKESEPPWYVI